MHDLWTQLRDLFDTDDGSLPDIFIENLSNDQVCHIYRWIRSQSEIYCDNRDPTFWDCVNERDVSIEMVDDPAERATESRAEPFRHGLTELSFSGVCLPQLTIAVFPNEIDFDYRMGVEWGRDNWGGLFDFLWAIQIMAPDANISHAFEGDSVRTLSFTESWKTFKRKKSDVG